MVTAATISEVGDALDGAPATRERLLDAGEELFAERGFHATSVRDITNAANSNLAAVNYHFGGKANLYRAVFKRRLAILRDLRVKAVERAIGQDARDLDTVLHAFALSYLEPLVAGNAGKRWVRLSSREMLDPQLPPELFFDEIVQPTQSALAKALQRLCPGLDDHRARLSAQSMVGQLMHIRLLHSYFTSTEAAGEATPPRAARKFELTEMTRHVVEFTAAAVRALAERG